MATRAALIWRKKHIENMIWSANKKGSLFNKKHIPGFKKELKEIIKQLK